MKKSTEDSNIFEEAFRAISLLAAQLEEEETKLNSGSRRKDPVIPKLIFQTYKSFGQLPPHWRDTPRSWKESHPDYDYKFYSDADCDALIADHFPWFLPIYKSYPEKIQRIDAFRPFALFQHGGVYIDCDIKHNEESGISLEDLKSIVEPALRRRETATAYCLCDPLGYMIDEHGPFSHKHFPCSSDKTKDQEVQKKERQKKVTNCFMMSAPRSSFLVVVMWVLCERARASSMSILRSRRWWMMQREWRILHTTGPGAWTEALRIYKNYASITKWGQKEPTLLQRSRRALMHRRIHSSSSSYSASSCSSSSFSSLSRFPSPSPPSSETWRTFGKRGGGEGGGGTGRGTQRQQTIEAGTETLVQFEDDRGDEGVKEDREKHQERGEMELEEEESEVLSGKQLSQVRQVRQEIQEVQESQESQVQEVSLQPLPTEISKSSLEWEQLHQLLKLLRLTVQSEHLKEFHKSGSRESLPLIPVHSQSWKGEQELQIDAASQMHGAEREIYSKDKLPDSLKRLLLMTGNCQHVRIIPAHFFFPAICYFSTLSRPCSTKGSFAVQLEGMSWVPSKATKRMTNRMMDLFFWIQTSRERSVYNQVLKQLQIFDGPPLPAFSSPFSSSPSPAETNAQRVKRILAWQAKLEWKIGGRLIENLKFLESKCLSELNSFVNQAKASCKGLTELTEKTRQLLVESPITSPEMWGAWTAISIVGCLVLAGVAILMLKVLPKKIKLKRQEKARRERASGRGSAREKVKSLN